MSKPTVIEIEVRGDSGDSSSRARVMQPNQKWVRRSSGVHIAARDAAASFFRVPNCFVAVFQRSGSASFFARICVGQITPWKARRSPTAILQNVILIEEGDDVACPIGMVHDGDLPHHKARGDALATLVCAAPRYHGAVAALMCCEMTTLEFRNAMIDLFNEVEDAFAKIPQPSTGGES